MKGRGVIVSKTSSYDADEKATTTFYEVEAFDREGYPAGSIVCDTIDDLRALGDAIQSYLQLNTNGNGGGQD